MIEHHVEPTLGVQLTLPSIPIDAGSRPGLACAPRRRSPSPPRGADRAAPSGTSRRPSRPARRNAGGDDAPNQMGIGRCTGSGAMPAPVTCSDVLERHGALGEEPAQELDLLGDCARRDRRSSLPSASYSTGFQPTPMPSRKRPSHKMSTSAACLATSAVCRCGRMIIAGHQLELCDAGEEAEQHERLVEGRVDVVGPRPALVHSGVGAEHVVVREEVCIPELFDAGAVRAHRAHIRADLGLREHHADLHRLVSIAPRSVCNAHGGARDSGVSASCVETFARGARRSP